MSNNYVKKYDMGEIKLDLPYANYIHELPLLSFGDVLHTFDLSLVFNYENKNVNPFFIANGYQLNLQKRIIESTNVTLQIKFQDGAGKSVYLTDNSNGIYTFPDDSQKILRRINSGYVLEYSDFSKEFYNSDGYITAVCDKYSDTPFLTYTYDESGRLISISYGDKIIALQYNSNKLAKISYAETTTHFSYATNKITVNHYSGNKYELSLSASDMSYTAKGSSSDETENATYSKELLVEDNATLTVKDKIGEATVNKISYTFPGYASNYIIEMSEQVDITNNNGVKTRIQYYGKHPTYSYEIQEDNVEFTDESPNGRFKGNINIHNTHGIPINNKATCIQTMNDGIPMIYKESDNRWDPNISQNTEKSEYYILSGWAKIDDLNTLPGETLRIRSNDYNLDNNYDNSGAGDILIYINFPKNSQWTYFACMLNIPTDSLNIVTEHGNFISMRDFRITFQHTYDNNSSRTDRSESILFNGDMEQSIDETTFYCNKNGNDTELNELGDITIADILKYKLNQKRNGTCNEVYFNNCRELIPNTEDFKVLWGENYISIDNLDVGIKTYSNNRVFLTRFNINTNNSNSIEKIQRAGNTVVSTELFDNNFDVVESIVDGVATHYERNGNGLVTKEYISELYRYDTTYADGYIATKEIDPSTGATISTTKYYIDGTWGGVNKIEVLDSGNVVQSTVTDTYDGDMGALMSKAFGNRVNYLGYSNGNLETLESGDLKYKMTYSDGYLAGVIKCNKSTNEFNSIESHVHNQSNGETTVTSKYPSATSALYTQSTIFDKYDRLKEIAGVLVNTYDISPTYDGENGYVIKGIDTVEGKLATTQDLIRNTILKYAYEDSCLSRVATVDGSNIIQEETFVYDGAERLIKDRLSYGANNSFESVIEYDKPASECTSNNRVNRYSCYLNGATSPIAKTENKFDEFKRVKDKKFTINSGEFKRTFDFTGARVRSMVEMFDFDTPRPLTSSNYQYDAMGRIVYTSANGSATTYTYDEYGQLIREDNKALDKTFQYEYNGIGSIMYVHEYPYTPAGTEPSGTPTTTSFTYNTSKPDVLTKIGNKNVGSNSNGALTSYIRNYTWSNGKLSKFMRGSKMMPGGIYEECNYTYNGFGQRISKTYAYDPNPAVSNDASFNYTKTYKYDHSGRLINEKIVESHNLNGNSTREFVYLYDESSMVGFTYSLNGTTPQAYYYQRNLFGDVIAIYNTNGAKIVEYAYDAWGNCTTRYSLNDNLANDNPIRYRGYYLDIENNFYYLNARYYSPEFRRFISPANVSALNPHAVNGLNLYCYCNNNPINVQYNTVTSNSTDIGGVTVSSMSLVADIGTTFSNGFHLGFSFPSLSFNSLLKNTLLSLSEVSGTLFYSLTNNGKVMINYHQIFDGVDGFTVLDNLPHPVNSLFKALGITLSLLDTVSAGFDSYNSSHSFGQGALNVALTAGKNYMIYKAGAYVTTAVGTWAGAKLGALMGSWAGPVGMVVGVTIGTVVGYLIDEFGDAIIDWIVGWFD